MKYTSTVLSFWEVHTKYTKSILKVYCIPARVFFSIWNGQLMLTQDLKLSEVLIFLVYKCFSLFMFWLVSDYVNLKLKDNVSNIKRKPY